MLAIFERVIDKLFRHQVFDVRYCNRQRFSCNERLKACHVTFSRPISERICQSKVIKISQKSLPKWLSFINSWYEFFSIFFYFFHLAWIWSNRNANRRHQSRSLFLLFITTAAFSVELLLTETSMEMDGKLLIAVLTVDSGDCHWSLSECTGRSLNNKVT